jgi:hypothetical protein
MRGARRSQLPAFLVFAAVASVASLLALACTNYQRANGDACLKDVDCLTGYCQAQVCATPPAGLNGSSYVEAGLIPSEDAGSSSVDAGSGDADSGDTGTTSTGDAIADSPADG